MLASSQVSSKQVIKSVLGYLHGMERLATISNDRSARNHFEECWAMVWRAYYGGYSLPVARRVQPGHVDMAAPPASKPAWLIAKYARPTRKVIARIVDRVPMGSGQPPMEVSYDVLECGHRLEGNDNYGAGPPAKHRRCGLCVTQEDKASDQPQRAANNSPQRGYQLR